VSLQEERLGSPEIDRRRFLKRAGTIAWSTPVIITLLAQSAAASHPSGCIHDGAECGVYNGATRVCDDFPSDPGSTGDCCLGAGRCKFSVRVNGQPCICR
jgi:hypothetical protein